MKRLDEYELPSDLKSLDNAELCELAQSMREFLIEKIAQVGGHFGPNLGIIEPAIALHKVFNSPVDKIVWDVSHQSLPHKILTGRYQALTKFHEDGGGSAFTNPNESEHDFFINGHTSTSISQALGLAKARDFASISGDPNAGVTENVIAVIGDGSLSGGQAFESLNNAGNLQSNLIIVVNDNEMSIDFNSGGLYKGLAELRRTNGMSENNIFKFMGLDYVYLEDGNDITALTQVFEQVKGHNKPIVVHIHTQKGKGYEIAVKSPELWHYHSPFDISTGQSTVKRDEKRALLSNNVSETVEYLRKNDNALVFIPGAPLSQVLQQNVPERYVDTGIAEQTAISYGASVANAGVKSYMVIASTFLQRAYDQIIHDWLLNKARHNKSATLIVYSCGVTATDATHSGIFDIPMLSNLPGLVYICPTNDTEYQMMLDWCDQQPFPTAIRLPAGVIPDDHFESRNTLPISAHLVPKDLNNVTSHTINGGIIPAQELIVKSEVIQKGSKIAIMGLGIWLETAYNLADLLKSELNITPTIINPRFVSHLDKELLTELKTDHDYVITIEGGIVEGGFGSKIASFYAADDMKTLIYGVQKEFLDSIKYSSIIERYHLSEDLIFADIKKLLEGSASDEKEATA